MISILICDTIRYAFSLIQSQNIAVFKLEYNRKT